MIHKNYKIWAVFITWNLKLFIFETTCVPKLKLSLQQIVISARLSHHKNSLMRSWCEKTVMQKCRKKSTDLNNKLTVDSH